MTPEENAAFDALDDQRKIERLEAENTRLRTALLRLIDQAAHVSAGGSASLTTAVEWAHQDNTAKADSSYKHAMEWYGRLDEEIVKARAAIATTEGS